MKKILVIGASGFVGKRVAKALLAEGYQLRCLARKPEKVEDLRALGCETVQGDISDAASLNYALATVDAVYISIQTLVSQHSSTEGKGFMDIEMDGLRNIIEACKIRKVTRLIYITFLGVAPDAKSAWIRGRWQAEQLLLNSGLDVTVIRPGMIVGSGGQGFNMLIKNAGSRVAIVMGSGKKRYRSIAIDDLVFYLTSILENEHAYGQCYDVGNNDILNMNDMINSVASVIGKPHPFKIHIPIGLLTIAAPLIERMSKAPKGAIKGMLDSTASEMIGDPLPIRKLAEHMLLSFKQAAERAVNNVS
ncbi:SDR family NAD(P)-dependent oxidoreductase [Mucilaginibacter sp.]|uniref:SDR family oxidoreductase n=1 Tax=Mucilaginibacter sp. TaxID=1882438 RepID=UPI0025EE7DDB|nr:SDR family NAD(P)-dependent oxidoreductase [Mucilaginibacter sp.]